MGLNLNVPESQLSDKVLREHRNRVWWSAYELDRLLAARLSQPFSIQDDEIQVDLPTDAGLPKNNQEDFISADDLVNRITLVKLTGDITKLLYGRKTENQSFLQRVQHALKNLQDWYQKLEGSLHTDGQHPSGTTSEPRRSLLLSFNQVRISKWSHCSAVADPSSA
jgi:proline utilization trans-activator